MKFDFFSKKSTATPLYWRQPKVFKPANIDNSHKPIDSIEKSYI